MLFHHMRSLGVQLTQSQVSRFLYKVQGVYGCSTGLVNLPISLWSSADAWGPGSDLGAIKLEANWEVTKPQYRRKVTVTD